MSLFIGLSDHMSNYDKEATPARYSMCVEIKQTSFLKRRYIEQRRNMFLWVFEVMEMYHV